MLPHVPSPGDSSGAGPRHVSPGVKRGVLISFVQR